MSDLGWQIVLALFATFTQVAVRPALSAAFYLYAILDPTEIEDSSQPAWEEQNKYIEDIEMLAPGQFRDGEFIMFDDGLNDVDIQQMTMDEALEGLATKENTLGGTFGNKALPALTSSIGGYHLMDQLDGIDAAIPLEEDVIILEDSDEGVLDDIGIDPSDVQVGLGFGGTFGGTTDSFVASSSKNKRSSTKAESTLGRSGTVGTLGRLGAEIREDEVFQETAQSNPITETNSFEEDEDEEKDLEVVIITRHLLNFRKYGYLIAATYIVLCAIITYLNTAGWYRSTLNVFWRVMIIAALWDLVVLEPLYMLLVLLYKWLTSETPGIVPTELHPYEGEERFREDEDK